MKIGIGFDLHRFADGRKLVLGGVNIPYIKGLEGHSDADTLIHAICDAILGAIGEDDIGKHFPDEDPKYRDISSVGLLKEVKDIAAEKNYFIGNVDTTLIMDEPKIDPFRKEMKETIAKALSLNSSQVNVKATTSEGVGTIGRGEAVAAYAVVLLAEEKRSK